MPRKKKQDETETVDAIMVTWLGEDGLHPEGHGPNTNKWLGVTFKKGEPVEVTDPHIIAKAKTNKFYSVEEPSEPATDE